MGLTRINNQALPTLDNNKLPSGSVLQVKRFGVDIHTPINFTSATWTDTGGSVSITPNAVGNKLLVFVSYSMLDNPTGYGSMKLLLDGVDIGSTYQIGYVSSGTNRYTGWQCQHEHTTTTTNAHVFKTQITSPSGTTQIHNASSSGITVMEIAG